MFGKSKIRVLFIDNIDQTRDFARSLLEGKGVYKVVAVSNSTDAWKEIKKKAPDLIISEAELPPGNGGFHFYKQIKQDTSTAKIPFIFFTGVEELAVEEVIKKEDVFVPKSSKSKIFLQQVDKLVKANMPAEKTTAKKLETKKRHKTNKQLAQTGRRTATGTVIKEFIIPLKAAKRSVRRKKTYQIVPLPPGRSTKQFVKPHEGSAIAFLFDVKGIKEAVTKVLKELKAGKFQFAKDVIFKKSKKSYGPLFKDPKIPDIMKHYVPLEEDEEEIFMDMDLEEDEVLVDIEEVTPIEDLKEQEESTLEEEPAEKEPVEIPDATEEIAETFTFQWSECTSDLNIADTNETIIQKISTTNITSTTPCSITPKNLHKLAHAVFSMAGLCSEICELDVDVDYLLIETEKENLLWGNNVKNDAYAFTLLKEVHWK